MVINNMTQKAIKEKDIMTNSTTTNKKTTQHAELYKAIEKYNEAKQRLTRKDFVNYINLNPKIFKDYVNAEMILSYEIGIYKELREEPVRKIIRHRNGLATIKNVEIKLVGVRNSDYNADKALKEYANDPVKLAIIKEDIADGDAIQEYYDDF